MLPIIGTILGIAEKFIPDPDKQIELKKAILAQEQAIEKEFVKYANMDHQLRLKEIELTGFKASWRPYIMFTFSTIIAIYCILSYIVPSILIYFPEYDYVGLIEPVKIDPALWDLVKYSILGIGGMRTIDKWRNK